MSRYELWRHTQTGERFAVEIDDETDAVIALSQPLGVTDQTVDLSAYDVYPEDADWANERLDRFERQEPGTPFGDFYQG